MTSMHHLANNKLDSHISKPIAVIIILTSSKYELKKAGQTELPFPEMTCLSELLSFAKFVLLNPLMTVL